MDSPEYNEGYAQGYKVGLQTGYNQGYMYGQLESFNHMLTDPDNLPYLLSDESALDADIKAELDNIFSHNIPAGGMSVPDNDVLSQAADILEQFKF